VCLIDAIKSGTTTLIDHHASPNAIGGSLDAIAAAVDQAVSARGTCAYEVTDRGGDEKMRAGIAEKRALYRARPAGSGRQAGGWEPILGCMPGLTLSEHTLQACREAIPDGSGFHVHVAEDASDEYDSLARSGMRVADRLARYGILKTQNDRGACRQLGCQGDRSAGAEWGLGHAPAALQHEQRGGVAPVESMLRQGIKVCVGNDGFTHDMWQEWKTAYFPAQGLAPRPQAHGRNGCD